MTTPIAIGSERTVILGESVSDSTGAFTSLAYNAAGLELWTQVGDDAPIDRTASLINVPGDWYWRYLGAGLVALTIPASFFVEANVGKMLRVMVNATGVHPFGNRESLIIVDAAYIEANNQDIADRAAGGFGFELDQSVIPNVLHIIRLSDGVTVASLQVTTGSRNPFIALGS